MTNIRIAYINLGSRPDRDEAFLAHNRAELDDSGLPWCRVEGVDGSALAANPLGDLVERGIVAGDGLPPGYAAHTWGHLGCALSHGLAWRQALESGDGDVTVILEDDGQVCPDFGPRLRRVLELADELGAWDVVHLGFNADAPVTIRLGCPELEIRLTCQVDGRPVGLGTPLAIRWPERPPDDHFLLGRVVDFHGICGYAITREGAGRLLETCFPMTATSIDGTMSRRAREGELRAFLAIPPLVLSPNAHEDSDTVRSAPGATPRPASRYNEPIPS